MGTHPIFESDFDCLTEGYSPGYFVSCCCSYRALLLHRKMQRRSHTVQVKGKTVTHDDCRRILDTIEPKKFKTESPGKKEVEQRKLGKENATPQNPSSDDDD